MLYLLGLEAILVQQYLSFLLIRLMSSTNFKYVVSFSTSYFVNELEIQQKLWHYSVSYCHKCLLMSTFFMLCSLYSKYGIHSLPAILLVNQTSRLRYRGLNNLLSLLEFYERNTRKHILNVVCKFTLHYLRQSFSRVTTRAKSMKLQ